VGPGQHPVLPGIRERLRHRLQDHLPAGRRLRQVVREERAPALLPPVRRPVPHIGGVHPVRLKLGPVLDLELTADPRPRMQPRHIDRVTSENMPLHPGVDQISPRRPRPALLRLPRHRRHLLSARTDVLLLYLLVRAPLLLVVLLLLLPVTALLLAIPAGRVVLLLLVAVRLVVLPVAALVLVLLVVLAAPLVVLAAPLAVVLGAPALAGFAGELVEFFAELFGGEPGGAGGLDGGVGVVQVV